MAELTSKDFALDDFTSCTAVSESSMLMTFTEHGQQSMDLAQRNAHMQNWLNSIVYAKPCWLIDYVLAYDSLLIEYDCLQVNLYQLVNELRVTDILEAQAAAVTIHSIDVCYGFSSENMPSDLSDVCKHTKLTQKDFIQLHSSQRFTSFAVGFMPCFAYLGELPENMAVPRLATPRLKVPAGAVAIADTQVAIYPQQSPGGWNIVGYTTQIPSETNKINVGDKVQFRSIDKDQFLRQKQQLEEQKHA